jgi:hypothetical protein
MPLAIPSTKKPPVTHTVKIKKIQTLNAVINILVENLRCKEVSIMRFSIVFLYPKFITKVSFLSRLAVSSVKIPEYGNIIQQYARKIKAFISENTFWKQKRHKLLDSIGTKLENNKNKWRMERK